MGLFMIDFETELKKFEKSTEFDDIQDALSSIDITDMNDIVFKILKELGNK